MGGIRKSQEEVVIGGPQILVHGRRVSRLRCNRRENLVPTRPPLNRSNNFFRSNHEHYGNEQHSPRRSSKYRHWCLFFVTEPPRVPAQQTVFQNDWSRLLRSLTWFMTKPIYYMRHATYTNQTQHNISNPHRPWLHFLRVPDNFRDWMPHLRKRPPKLLRQYFHSTHTYFDCL